MIEEWKEVKGYEGIYEVSTFGRVKSLSREIVRGNRINISKEVILKNVINNYGYYQVSLCKNKASINTGVHKLIAITFLNHTPCGHKLIIDHIDNNPLNNKLENIQLITARENSSKDKKNKTSKYTGVSIINRSKKWLSSIQINGDKVHLGYFDTELEASEYYQNALKSINEGTDIIKKEAVFSSKFTGVHWAKQNNKWKAKIYENKKHIHLGYFINEIDASNAYQKALLNKIAPKLSKSI